VVNTSDRNSFLNPRKMAEPSNVFSTATSRGGRTALRARKLTAALDPGPPPRSSYRQAIAEARVDGAQANVMRPAERPAAACKLACHSPCHRVVAGPGHGQSRHARPSTSRAESLPGESFARAEVEANVFVLRAVEGPARCPIVDRRTQIRRRGHRIRRRASSGAHVMPARLRRRYSSVTWANPADRHIPSGTSSVGRTSLSIWPPRLVRFRRTPLCRRRTALPTHPRRTFDKHAVARQGANSLQASSGWRR